MNEIEAYFRACVKYWMSTGLNEGHAIVRAIWWDCVEVWNADKSWNKDKVNFINKFRRYQPYEPTPDDKLVEEGNA